MEAGPDSRTQQRKSGEALLYEADMQVQGTVEVNEGFPLEKKEQLALVNGFSVLYSAAERCFSTLPPAPLMAP